MGALHRFEQRLETMVTGAFARAFRSAVQPMEIAAALQREVDNSAQILSRDRRLAPNDFTIDLSASDFDRLSEYGQTLSAELAAMLHEHAREQHYMFAGPLKLDFTRADDLTTGRFRVRSAASAAVVPSADHNVTDTTIGKAAVVLEIGSTRQPLPPSGLVIGRGSTADIRIDDAGVSRRHVEFRPQDDPRGTTVLVVDLGSTNGTQIDGQRVQHATAHDGTVVQVGGTKVVVRIGAASTSSPSPAVPDVAAGATAAPEPPPPPAASAGTPAPTPAPTPAAPPGPSPSDEVYPPYPAPAERPRTDRHWSG